MLDAHIVKVRPEFTVDVRIRIDRGARVGIFGASGEGKSTILSCIAGVESPSAGEIRLGRTLIYPPPLPLHLRPLAYLTQKDLLFPHLTVGENVCFGLDHRLRRNPITPLLSAATGDREWIGELQNSLGLAQIWNAAARKISGGQARRVALARMLARRPPLVLLDEPFTALDQPLTNDLIDALIQWQTRLGFTLIAVDHRNEILERLCPHAVVIERGRIVQEGAWSELIAAPATPLLARLLSASARP